MMSSDNKDSGSHDNDIRQKYKGAAEPRFGGTVQHFRGIPYASIQKRFAKPVLVTDWEKRHLDFTEYGPVCPQPHFEPEKPMLIPDNLPRNKIPEFDELLCCNLNVTTPSSLNLKNLPVLFWIHGGGQATSFPAACHRAGDPGPIIAQSLEMGKPIILVTINYRLNCFGFGDPINTSVNLAMQDQMVALQWVEANIHLFGGDKSNITAAGESAGGIYVHGLLALGVQFERVIMASGHLYLTPPQTKKRCDKVLQYVAEQLSAKITQSADADLQDADSLAPLYTATAAEIKQTVQDAGLYSWWMSDEEFSDWTNDAVVFANARSGIMLSDCKAEGYAYAPKIRHRSAAELLAAFHKLPGREGEAYRKAYGLVGPEPSYEACLNAAMDFITDARYAFWNDEIRRKLQSSGTKVYHYYYDEPNPFGNWPTLDHPIASHATDIFAIFGGFDDDVNEQYRTLGKKLRGKWIDFINGQEPWAVDKVYSFGPSGRDGLVHEEEKEAKGNRGRRRYSNFALLREIGLRPIMQTWQAIVPTKGVDN